MGVNLHLEALTPMIPICGSCKRGPRETGNTRLATIGGAWARYTDEIAQSELETILRKELIAPTRHGRTPGPWPATRRA